jgi:hypothetical protein
MSGPGSVVFADRTIKVKSPLFEFDDEDTESPRGYSLS